MDDFQIKIFQEVIKSNIGRNLLISPLSIYIILSLTTNGAKNNTLKEMLSALSNKDINQMNEANKLISSEINNYSSVELANGIFTIFNPIDCFKKIVKEYNAKIDQLENAEQINKWCSDATHDKIQKIIENVNKDDDLMILINAIYFKGNWNKEFDPDLTSKKTFMNFNKEPKETDFMYMKTKYYYYEDLEQQVISLDYKNDNIEALILLPKKENDINNYIANFKLETYNSIIQQLKRTLVKFSMPKFEISFSEELKPYLISLGMNDAFISNANFTGVTEENNIKIGRIIHKTFIKVNEEGTEAAAITYLEMKKKGSKRSKEKIVIMTVDHPFLFIIRANKLPSGHDMIFASKIEYI